MLRCRNKNSLFGDYDPVMRRPTGNGHFQMRLQSGSGLVRSLLPGNIRIKGTGYFRKIKPDVTSETPGKYFNVVECNEYGSGIRYHNQPAPYLPCNNYQ